MKKDREREKERKKGKEEWFQPLFPWPEYHTQRKGNATSQIKAHKIKRATSSLLQKSLVSNPDLCRLWFLFLPGFQPDLEEKRSAYSNERKTKSTMKPNSSFEKPTSGAKN